MAFLSIKSEPVPAVNLTLEERINSASALSASARNLFEVAADDLNEAAHQQILIRDEALAEAERLNEIARIADDEANRNAEAALKLRELVNPA